MKLLVTGAGGLLGRDVARAARHAGHEVVALTHRQLDVTNARAARAQIGAERPSAVVNCAAYTDVDGAEDDRDAADAVNARGAEAVASAGAEVGASVLYPSSDYVFDGPRSRPWVESDEPRPRSAYARSKLAGERATAAANDRHFVVRSAWLFGIGGPNFIATMLRLGGERDELTVVDDQVGSPTYTGHLAHAVVSLVEGEAYGVHHAAAAGECSWNELTREAFRQAGVTCRVERCTAAELGRRAPRPAYSALASERSDGVRLPPWQEGVAAYLAERERTDPVATRAEAGP